MRVAIFLEGTVKHPWTILCSYNIVKSEATELWTEHESVEDAILQRVFSQRRVYFDSYHIIFSKERANISSKLTRATSLFKAELTTLERLAKKHSE